MSTDALIERLRDVTPRDLPVVEWPALMREAADALAALTRERVEALTMIGDSSEGLAPDDLPGAVAWMITYNVRILRERDDWKANAEVAAAAADAALEEADAQRRAWTKKAYDESTRAEAAEAALAQAREALRQIADTEFDDEKAGAAHWREARILARAALGEAT